jgi:hypothetical protein
MAEGKRYSRALAVLGLATVAGAVHAEEALRTMAVAAFPDVQPKTNAASADDAVVEEGADLKRVFRSQRAARNAAPQQPVVMVNPYGAPSDDGAHARRAFEQRVGETYSDDRWGDPYPIARNTYTDERWSNPYVVVRDTGSDERWSNPYVAVQNTTTDERWSNPYAPSAKH